MNLLKYYRGIHSLANAFWFSLCQRSPLSATATAFRHQTLTNTFACNLCHREMLKDSKNRRIIYYSGKSNQFCSEACQNVFVMQNFVS